MRFLCGDGVVCLSRSREQPRHPGILDGLSRAVELSNLSWLIVRDLRRSDISHLHRLQLGKRAEPLGGAEEDWGWSFEGNMSLGEWRGPRSMTWGDGGNESVNLKMNSFSVSFPF